MIKPILITFLSIMIIPVFAPSHPEYVEVEPPLQQILQGVLPEHVTCEQEKQLIYKVKDGMPICVKQNTAQRLLERGWAAQDMPEQSYVKSKATIKQDIESSIPTFEVVPAASGTSLNFYINDDDLNTSPNGVDIISTTGLVEITINGITIDVPSKMVETSPGSGKFAMIVSLPDEIDGQALDQDDIVLIKYLDQSDKSGNKKTVTASFALAKTFANMQTSGGGTRIGHEFTVRVYEPDFNKDSRNEDKIPLSYVEFRSGGIRTTLANPVFDARPSYLLETGENSNIFEVKIKIPRSVDGKTIHIGDSYELRYIDTSTPSGTSEKVILKNRIG